MSRDFCKAIKMLMTKKIFSLYSDLEKDYNTARNMFSYFDNIQPLSDEEKLTVSFERCFLTMLPGNFYAEYWDEDAKKQATEYLRKRIKDSKNIYLLTRYELHLFRITNDYHILTKGIDDSLEMLRQLMTIDDFKTAHTFCERFEFLYPLAKKVNKSGEFDKILKLGLQSSSPTYQRFILSMLYFSDQCQNNIVNPDTKSKKPLQLGKIFSAKVLANLALERSEDKDINNNEHLLEIALFYADKTQNKDLKKIANEKLGKYWLSQQRPDDPKNLAIAHLNDHYLRKALSCFQRAKNISELHRTEKLLEENKTKLKYILFSHSIPMEERNAQIEQINKIVKDIVKGGVESILAVLLGLTPIDIFGNSVEKLEENARDEKNRLLYTNMCSHAIVDSFGNFKEVSHEQLYIHQIASYMYQNFTYHIFSLAIMNGLKQHALTYDILSNYLIKLGFDHKIAKAFDENAYSTTYLDSVDIGLKEFLHQNELLLNNQPTDWRFCIIFLTTQFEGLLRDIVKKLGGVTTKAKHGNDTELVLLEGLLSDDCLKNVFDANDMLLFKETFTNYGYNIRNNIAHGMYLPQEYTSTKALLVFICILRLAKATTKIS